MVAWAVWSYGSAKAAGLDWWTLFWFLPLLIPFGSLCQMKPSMRKTVLGGIAGGAAMNLVMLLTFRLLGFGWKGQGILLNPEFQSRKLIAVWTEMEPLPLVVANPAPIILGLIVFGVIHAFLYRWLSSAWAPGTIARGLRLACLVFFVAFLFWEFFTPFNQFGEPLPLIGLELFFWALIALADGISIAAIMER